MPLPDNLRESLLHIVQIRPSFFIARRLVEINFPQDNMVVPKVHHTVGLSSGERTCLRTLYNQVSRIDGANASIMSPKTEIGTYRITKSISSASHPVVISSISSDVCVKSQLRPRRMYKTEGTSTSRARSLQVIS